MTVVSAYFTPFGVSAANTGETNVATTWTDDRIKKLKELWEKGLTASQISQELGGITRNAVIGKAHRLGLSGRPSPVKSTTKRTTSKKKAKEPEAELVTLLTLTEHMCKWPIGHPGDDGFHFCGKDSEPGQPYCQDHADQAYQTTTSRRDRATS